MNTKSQIKPTGREHGLSSAPCSRPNHPRASDIHPLTKLPTGYIWMESGGRIVKGCKYVRFHSPRWNDVTNPTGEYHGGSYWPMARPIYSENSQMCNEGESRKL